MTECVLVCMCRGQRTYIRGSRFFPSTILPRAGDRELSSACLVESALLAELSCQPRFFCCCSLFKVIIY